MLSSNQETINAARVKVDIEIGESKSLFICKISLQASKFDPSLGSVPTSTEVLFHCDLIGDGCW